MKRWLLIGSIVVVLFLLGLTATRWAPALLSFASDNSATIEGLTGLVQLALWVGAAAVFVWGVLRGRRASKQSAQTPQYQATNSGSGSVAQNHGVSTGAAGRAVGTVEGDAIVGDQVNHIVNVYLRAPGRPSLDEEAFLPALGRYLAWVEKCYGRLNLRGIERRERQVLTLTLDDVYVSLAAAVSPERQRGKTSRSELAHEAQAQVEIVDMSKLLHLSQRLVITGGPGSGKTTFLHIIASTLARGLRTGDDAAVRRDLGWDGPLPLPLFVSLSEYNRYRREHTRRDDPRQGTLIAFISHALIRQQAAIGLPDDFFERLLVQGRSCILLLDGLDEVANERERQQVSLAVENLAHNEGAGRIVVTSRTRAYQGRAVLPEEFRVAEVQPMSPDQVHALAARWCGAVYDEMEAQRETQRLQDEIDTLEQVRQARGGERLVDAPLLVTIVAIVHYNQRRLPEERAELYEKCVEVLLTDSHHPATEATFELADWGGPLSEKRSLLAFVAYQMMSAGQEAGRSVSETQLTAWLRPRVASKWGEDQADEEMAKFIQAVRERGSLLTTDQGGDYRFIHLAFQEFLCAYYLAESVRELDRMVDFLADKGRVADSWWRETALLLVGYLGLKSQEAALTLVRRLADLDVLPVASLAGVELAGVGLLELDSRDEPTQSLIVRRLKEGVTNPSLALLPPLRAAAGVALGRLGDPRPGVGVQDGVPVIDWIEIEPGPFLMGSAKGEEKYPDELPQFVCNLIRQPYRISRFPITVLQYAAFVDAGGYGQQRFWTRAGWQWRQSKPIVGPRVSGGVYQTANHPQVGVSWYEAVAFCAWLSQQLGIEVTLPSEAQWERAARHTDGRTYSWGRSGDPYKHCNGVNSGIGATSAVGVFPQGNALCGAADMVGNVWEWCCTKWLPNYEGYEGRVDNNLDGTERRVLRGGSFANGVSSLRCAARSYFDPYYWGDGVGFRVCASP